MNAWMDPKHAEYFVKGRPPYHEVVMPWLKEYYEEKFPPEGRKKIPLMIDVACGTGQLTGRFAGYCERVIGFDISPAMIEVAKRVNGWPNIDYRVGNALELEKVCPNEQADIIMVGMAINYFNTEEFFSKVRDHLKPGGVFAIFGYRTPGLEIVGLEDFIGEFLEEQITEEPYCTELASLNRSYADVQLPFNELDCRSDRLMVSADRNRLTARLLSNEKILKDGEQGVHDLLEGLPSTGYMELFCDCFGVMTYK